MKKIFFLLLLTSVFILPGCKKNEQDASYKGNALIIMGGDANQGAAGDSTLYSFAIWPIDTVSTNINLIVQTTGNLSAAEREFKIEVDAAASTALAAEYEFPTSFKIPAQGFRVVLPVKIKRSARLTNTQVKLALKIVATKDFAPGPSVPGAVVSGPTFKIIWNDMLIKPTFWDPSGTNNLQSYFGKWSKVKHQLIIDATGIRNFSGLALSTKYNMQSKSQEFLNNYNAAHPGNPLKDENGVVIAICNGCN